jgi:hypothetical protein
MPTTLREMEHVILRVEPGGYIHFACSKQPRLELRSFEAPKICPICRHINPIKMGGLVQEYLETVEPREVATANALLTTLDESPADDAEWVTK